MKIIRKSVFIVGCSLSMVTLAAPSNSGLYDKLYRLAEKMYYLEYTLSPEKQRMVDELSSQIEAVINEPDEITCGTIAGVFQDAYKWSYSSEGMNATSSAAEKFATDVVNKLCPGAYLKVFKPGYNFAYSISGMNKTRADAKLVATRISDYAASTFYTKNTVQCYIDSYEFAYSSGGMNKTRSEAEKFANQRCIMQ